MPHSEGHSPPENRVSAFFEVARIAIALGAGIYALRPFLHDGILGGDDAKWYTAVVADHIEQWKMGFWPAFVGQTRFAAIGTVVPLRVAPLLQFLTLALDFITLHRLSAYLLLNLAIVVSGSAGGLSAYLCFRSILPTRRVEALLLSLLYIWSPGVIGLPYTGQLFMSEMTLPFLPMAFVGAYRIFAKDDFSGWALATVGCAGCWLAHSPIGFWVTVAVSMVVGVRWLYFRRKLDNEFKHAAAACVLFIALCGYVFVSILYLTPPEEGTNRAPLIVNVQQTFPAVLQPVSPIASYVTDLQLGWSLWAFLIGGVSIALYTKKPALVAFAVSGMVLLCFALPIPGVNRWLWMNVPHQVVDVTNWAPTQRLYAVLAALASTLAAACFAALPKKQRIVEVVLVVGVFWSGYELRPFLVRGALITNPKARTEADLLPENLALTRFSLGMLTYGDRFISNGVMDFNLEQRVLAANRRTYIVSDVASLAPGHDFGRRVLFQELPNLFLGNSRPGDQVWVNLDKTITLMPGQHYLLALDFGDSKWDGLLQLKGDGFYREYSLPYSGYSFSFGSAKFSSRVIPLETSGRVPLELTVTFINQDPDADMRRYHHFAHYQLIPYDPSVLPIQVKSMAPLVVEVTSPAPGWLETSRCFTPGWTATVDGRPATVIKSWNDLVAVQIGAGKSEVQLNYKPQRGLLVAFGCMIASWIGVAGYGAWRIRPQSLS